MPESPTVGAFAIVPSNDLRALLGGAEGRDEILQAKERAMR